MIRRRLLTGLGLAAALAVAGLGAASCSPKPAQTKTTPKELTFSILKAHDISINLVSEEELREAQRFVWERTKLIIEPSSAVAVAPLFKGEFSGRVGVVITGGNVDLTGLFGP